MSKSNAEMEDAEKLPGDSGNNVQESTSEIVDANVDSKAEKLPCAPAIQGDVNTREGDEQTLDESRNKDLEKTEVKAEVKDQTDSEANEPLEGSVPGKINIKSENEELIESNTEAEAQTATGNALEGQCEPNKSELLEQNGTSGVIEENSTANGVDSGNFVNNVEEKNNQGVAEIKREHSGNEDANYDEPLVGGEKTTENIDSGIGATEHRSLPPEVTADEVPQRQNDELNEVPHGEDKEMEPAANVDRDTTDKDDLKKESKDTCLASSETDGHAKTGETAIKHDGKDSSLANQHEAVTPVSHIRHSPARAEDYSGETIKNVFTQATVPLMGESDDGTPEDQAAFIREIERFYRERAMEFKPPKFYGQPLNCLKLWRAVIRLGGYDRVTGSKLWRQVGESFHPPKTCTTVSWTFRIFYEKSLLEYERHKIQTGELQLPAATLPEASGVDGEGNGYQGSGSGRARRDAAARAMQGWHAQQHLGDGEDKDPNNLGKREKNLKSIGHKQKRPNEVEHSNKVARAESSKQLATSVVDVGPPADWVKINVRRNKDCFEVYALVPGLLREEVRVQSDPAGRLVITGQPEQVDNPWGITPFKKVVSLPARIDPLQTSAVVSLHGRLFVRVPFERSNAKV